MKTLSNTNSNLPNENKNENEKMLWFGTYLNGVFTRTQIYWR